MIIKKFTSKTEKDAIEAAKKELGENVVVMNVKEVKKKGVFSFLAAKQVEVTVALEDDRGGQHGSRAQDIIKAAKDTKPIPASVNPLSDSSQDTSKSIGGLNLGASNIEKKLDSLQTLLETQLKKEEDFGKNPNRNVSEDVIFEKTEAKEEDKSARETAEDNTEQDKFLKLLYNTMIDNEVDEKYANLIMEEADKNRKPNLPFDYILASIYQKMVLKFGKAECIVPSPNGAKLVFFVGPTGVGKTTTIAKVASGLVLEEKKKVAMLTTDTYRIAATEQLHTYADILEVPFKVIYTEDEMKEAVSVYKDYDFIFVDTSGHSHKNEDQMESTRKFLKSVEGIVEQQVFLVLSTTTKYQDLKRIADKYKQITDYQLIFTKLDETTAFGSLYNLKLYTNAPIAYVTYGQNVPDDIEKFQPQKTVRHLLGGK